MEQSMKNKPLIVLADDEEDLLILLEATLKREGFEVQISPNAENIWEIITVSHPDIVLMDITMRGVNGGAICRKIKNDSITKNIPVVLFSANHDVEKIATECGADDYLVKPYNGTEANSKFRRLLEKH